MAVDVTTVGMTATQTPTAVAGLLARWGAAALAGGLILTLGAAPGRAEQFVLFQQTFELTKATVDQAGSHYFVRGANLKQPPGNNWTAPVDYRNGTVHIRTEVLDKPASGEPNHWSYCYMPNKPIGPGYGCAGSGKYTEKGVYDRIEKMTSWWQNTAISWPQGIKEMHLVVKGIGDSGHLHKRADVDKLFPSKVRITMVQVSAGGTFDPGQVPGMESSPFDAGAPGGAVADAGAPVDPPVATGSGGASGLGGASGGSGGAGATSPGTGRGHRQRIRRQRRDRRPVGIAGGHQWGQHRQRRPQPQRWRQRQQPGTPVGRGRDLAGQRQRRPRLLGHQRRQRGAVRARRAGPGSAAPGPAAAQAALTSTSGRRVPNMAPPCRLSASPAAPALLLRSCLPPPA